jgi:hypothetical protein
MLKFYTVRCKIFPLFCKKAEPLRWFFRSDDFGSWKGPKKVCQKNSTNRLKSATDVGFITKFKKQKTGKITEIAPWLTSLVAENQSKR